MKKINLYDILIIILTIAIICGIILLLTKKKDSTEKQPVVDDEPIINPINEKIDKPKEPKYEKINFLVGMMIYYNPIKNDICDDYKEENSYIGVNNGCLRFYGLSNENGYVNMVLDHDLNVYATSWASRKDYPNEKTIKEVGISNYGDKNYGTFGNNNRGPVTILRLMLEYTSEWQTSVPAIYNYSNKYKIDYTGHKARMMTLADTKDICTEYKMNSNLYSSCPDWMYKQLGTSKSRLYWGYWLVDPSKNSEERAFRISNNGNVKDLYVDNEVGGVRPVLVIPEDKILLKIINN